MSKIILPFFLLLAPFIIGKAQTGTAMYNINSETKVISTVSTMMDQIGIEENISYSRFQSSNAISIGKSDYIVKTAVDKYTKSESGFNVIAIYKGTNKVLELKDYDMWTYMYNGETAIDYSKYTYNRYYIPLDLNEQTKVLCFAGWPYGGDLPYLTIIVLTENDVKLVYHKSVSIKEIVKSSNEYSIKIQTTLEEYNSSGILTTAPAYGSIYSRNGILYIKK